MFHSNTVSENVKKYGEHIGTIRRIEISRDFIVKRPYGEAGYPR